MTDNGNEITITGSGKDLFAGGGKAALEAILPGYVQALRWFGGKARTLQSVEIVEATPMPGSSTEAYIATIQANYADGGSQRYVLPLALAYGPRAEALAGEPPQAVIAGLRRAGAGEREAAGVLYDAAWDAEFNLALLRAIREHGRLPGSSGEIVAWATEAYGRLTGSGQAPLVPRVMGVEQSNTSVVYGESLILKLFRRLEEGTSPDLEIGRFLGEHGFTHTPPLVGAIERHGVEAEPVTIAILQGFVPNRGDAWKYTLQALDRYLDAQEGMEESALDAYLQSARLLGRRTAELHKALASEPHDPAFAPEPFSAAYLRSVSGAMLSLARLAFGLLGERLSSLPGEAREDARAVLDRQGEVEARLGSLGARELAATRIRCHGDYHLGQVLYTGSDFMIIDFEGEPARPLSERRDKYSPLKDVAGMLRSFHYAANTALLAKREAVGAPGDAEQIEQRVDNWHGQVSAAFLDEYLAVAAGASFLPSSKADLHRLLDAYLLEKAVYELIYELNNRPDWVRIPLGGILRLLTQ